MGMFTSAYDKCGNEYQFKTGDDQCEVYVIDKPAKHGYPPIADGVYSGLGDDAWAAVVMKDNRCIAIVPYPGADSDTWDVPDDFLDNLAKCYGIKVNAGTT